MYLQNKLGIDTKDLVNKDVIGVSVFGDNHYSFPAIFYPFKAMDKSGDFVNQHPCILCANSLPDYGISHTTKGIARVMSSLLKLFFCYYHCHRLRRFCFSYSLVTLLFSCHSFYNKLIFNWREKRLIL